MPSPYPLHLLHKAQNIHPYALRLRPGQDLKPALLQLCEDEGFEACCILTCVGSLHQANLRFADQKSGTLLTGPMEITSLVGTISRHGGHLHIALADDKGQMVGGHVLDGCIIHTTAEIVLGMLTDVRFTREPDETTGYRELHIQTLAHSTEENS